MTKRKIITYAIRNALIAVAYISLVAFLMANIEAWIGPDGGVLAVTAFLLLFVISAAVMGVTIFGEPVVWYLDSRKKEAVHLTLYTIAFLIVIALVVFLFIAI